MGEDEIVSNSNLGKLDKIEHGPNLVVGVIVSDRQPRRHEYR